MQIKFDKQMLEIMPSIAEIRIEFLDADGKSLGTTTLTRNDFLIEEDDGN